ncbi:MAG: hypothetical protein SGCHY_000161 [Lobulomycetales sp.]
MPEEEEGVQRYTLNAKAAEAKDAVDAPLAVDKGKGVAQEEPAVAPLAVEQQEDFNGLALLLGDDLPESEEDEGDFIPQSDEGESQDEYSDEDEALAALVRASASSSAADAAPLASIASREIGGFCTCSNDNDLDDEVALLFEENDASNTTSSAQQPLGLRSGKPRTTVAAPAASLKRPGVVTLPQEEGEVKRPKLW